MNIYEIHTYIHIHITVWIDVAVVEEGISYKYNINFTYFLTLLNLH